VAYSVCRCVYGSAVRNSKQALVAAIARYLEILKTSAKVSLNIEYQGPVELTIVQPSGISVTSKEENITEAVYKELASAQQFRLEFKVAGRAKNAKKLLREGSKVFFWYDEDKHQGNSMNVEFVTQYSDRVLNERMLVLFMPLNLIKAANFRKLAENMNSRLRDLWENVLVNYTGASMTKSEETYTLQKYEPDSIVMNIFGKLIKVRKT